jgi:hypothetical protein
LASEGNKDGKGAYHISFKRILYATPSFETTRNFIKRNKMSKNIKAK